MNDATTIPHRSPGRSEDARRVLRDRRFLRVALEAPEKVAGDRGIQLEGGGLALVAAGHPTSVHLTYPGIDYQVEVYDPSPAKALRVARSGHVRPAE
jgi:hypothetical protein